MMFASIFLTKKLAMAVLEVSVTRFGKSTKYLILWLYKCSVNNLYLLSFFKTSMLWSPAAIILSHCLPR